MDPDRCQRAEASKKGRIRLNPSIEVEAYWLVYYRQTNYCLHTSAAEEREGR
jgi:hypothetical protein